jgi:threonyl-tRNA synthetase
MTEAAQTLHVTLPDGKVLDVPHGSTIRDVAFKIGPGLGKACLGGKIDGGSEILDLRYRLTKDCKLSIVTDKTPDGLHVIRHSASHIMADAITKVWPDAKLSIGPATDEGFYYDIDLETRLVPEDLAKVEAEMAKVISADTPFERCAIERADALKKFSAAGEKYKVELIEGFDPTEEVSVYRHGHGAFEDLCRGPHVPSTGYVKAFKLLSIAGAYWRGDEKNKMLQRIYGTAFAGQKDLDAYLKRLEEAKLRDHRKLGKELGLFMMNPIAPASPFFLPRGTVIYNRLQQHMRELYKEYGYQEVITPQVFETAMFKQSGHWDHYRENMFVTKMEDREFGVKPMNCPGHTFIFAHEKRSYRELPLRIADFGRLHRYEKSGVTAGLTRVRTFCQDDAHIFASQDQIKGEIASLLKMMRGVYALFGFGSPKVFLSTRPASSLGDDALWEKAEKSLAEALAENDVTYTINKGDGAFYGPKIDFVVEDAIGRDWQLGTIQLDFQMPIRFDLKFTTKNDGEERPVMIHRAILGSLERFIGILIEQCSGNFPFWLAPEQARILTIGENHVAYGKEVLHLLRGAGVRAELDASDQRVGGKVREARLMRVPYLLTVGDREVAERKAAVRERPETDLGAMSLEALVSFFADLERSKK